MWIPVDVFRLEIRKTICKDTREDKILLTLNRIIRLSLNTMETSIEIVMRFLKLPLIPTAIHLPIHDEPR